MTTPSDGEVRRLGEGEADFLVRWCARHKHHTPTVDEAVAFLAAPSHCVFMAFEHAQPSTPVGMLYGYVLNRIDGRQMGLIYELEVVEAHRRRGHGRHLLEACLQAFTEARVLAVWLTTGRDNTPARELYRTADAEEIDDLLYEWKLRRV